MQLINLIVFRFEKIEEEFKWNFKRYMFCLQLNINEIYYTNLALSILSKIKSCLANRSDKSNVFTIDFTVIIVCSHFPIWKYTLIKIYGTVKNMIRKCMKTNIS
jgi:hypothetical protein